MSNVKLNKFNGSLSLTKLEEKVLVGGSNKELDEEVKIDESSGSKEGILLERQTEFNSSIVFGDTEGTGTEEQSIESKE